MPDCRKCGEYFPFSVKIDGKERNLGSRKYCLKCSPFGVKNTMKTCGHPSNGKTSAFQAENGGSIPPTRFMKQRYCSNPGCSSRRVHHDNQDEMRKHRLVSVPDSLSDEDPCFCSLTCAIVDGWYSIGFETEAETKARQDSWRAKNSKRSLPKP